MLQRRTTVERLGAFSGAGIREKLGRRNGDAGRVANSTGRALNNREWIFRSDAAGDSIERMNRSIQSSEEAKLIADILAGNTQLYHQLIRPYQRSVYIIALSCINNEGDAEDIAQETFIKAFRNLCTFRGDSKFSTWLISIALNEARNRIRRLATTRIASLDESIGDELFVSPALVSDWRELPSGAVERQEVRQLLQQAVATLPSIYQRVFLLRDVQELNVNETARILNITTSLVKVRLHRARIMLQRFLAPKLNAVVGASVHRDEPS
ncbi:MAG TPA: sigma-70 family RNA polymerase sigma factor [Acidobacteriaceae bacterium]|nr:sigma-70 family RNA polymerase sigma factor [Acidobacteriaceae bacterium]